MRQFPASLITALVEVEPLDNLAENVGHNLTVAELLGATGLAQLAEVKLGYDTTVGNPALRSLVAARPRIRDDQVPITADAAAAPFLITLLCSDGEILVGLPCYPPALDTMRDDGVRWVVTVPSSLSEDARMTPASAPPDRCPEQGRRAKLN